MEATKTSITDEWILKVFCVHTHTHTHTPNGILPYHKRDEMEVLYTGEHICSFSWWAFLVHWEELMLSHHYFWRPREWWTKKEQESQVGKRRTEVWTQQCGHPEVKRNTGYWNSLCLHFTCSLTLTDNTTKGKFLSFWRSAEGVFHVLNPQPQNLRLQSFAELWNPLLSPTVTCCG